MTSKTNYARWRAQCETYVVTGCHGYWDSFQERCKLIVVFPYWSCRKTSNEMYRSGFRQLLIVSFRLCPLSYICSITHAWSVATSGWLYGWVKLHLIVQVSYYIRIIDSKSWVFNVFLTCFVSNWSLTVHAIWSSQFCTQNSWYWVTKLVRSVLGALEHYLSNAPNIAESLFLIIVTLSAEAW